MTSELSKTADSNREFLDSYLEIGIGHYYTLAKLLSSRISNELTEAERLSIGIEVAALATASLENLVTWYMALGRWKPREGRKLLPQILSGIHVEESDHLAALEHVKGMRTGILPLIRHPLEKRGPEGTSHRRGQLAIHGGPGKA